MTDRKNENYIGLNFFDFEFPHEIITKKLMLTPTNSKVKGATRIGDLLWKENIWHYEEKKVTDEYIGDLVEEFILRVIAPIRGKIKEILNECNGEIAIAQFYYNGCNPGCHFSKDILSLIGETGLEIDIDTYLSLIHI